MAYLPNTYALLATATSVNFNSVAETVLSINNTSSYVPLLMILSNGSGSMTTAVCDIRDATGGGGNQLVTAGSIGGDWTSGKVSITNVPSPFRNETGASLYFRVTTPEGGALTGDVSLYGLILS